jgi:dTDP-4-dehydrorhamnose reductase
VKILITGRQGQLVQSLLERGRDSGHELIALGRPELDLEQPGSAAAAVGQVRPDVVVSAAAYTAVDQAEDEPERAHRANGEAPGELAEAARQVGARIIHISTDYVFDGSKVTPYHELDPVAPLGAYGRSKLLGEEQVRMGNPDHLILRTAWVYSPWGKNFVKTMLALARTRGEISVVSDQHGNPTSALDIADGLLSILSKWSGVDPVSSSRIFHLAGTGTASWHELASHVFKECARCGLPSATARPITTADFPTKAARPKSSTLDSSAFESAFGYRAPHWRASVSDTVRRLAAELLDGQIDRE